MRTLLLFFALYFIQCSSASTGHVKNNNKYYPQKINDTFSYAGDLSFFSEKKGIDTNYADTFFVIRFHQDSIVFIFNKLKFLDIFDPITMAVAEEPFSINNKFEINIDDEASLYDIKYVFKDVDSLIYHEIDWHKSFNIQKEYFFKGKKL